MSDSAHTPGPWLNEGVYDGRGRRMQRVSLVTAGDPAQRPYCEIMIRGDCADNNARLIAAAPDMMLALLDLQVIAEQHINDLCADAQEGRKLDPIWKMEMARWQNVRHAFAKATGA